MNHNGPWNLPDLKKVQPNGRKVFSCFSSGGGSSMGYKLAGYEVVGCLEIGKKVFKTYMENIPCKHGYNMDIREFNKIPLSELPDELFDLDILDGSPPCSTFSIISTRRESFWGKEKKFAEGQKKQTLDDLFFHFIETVQRLRPKVVIAENVKGLIIGKAKWYVSQIIARLAKLGYRCQMFLLNARYMGVPQNRPRVFFIATRVDYPKLKLEFKEKEISCGKAFEGLPVDASRSMTAHRARYWEMCEIGKKLDTVHPKGKISGDGFSFYKLSKLNPSPTIPANSDSIMHWNYPRYINVKERQRLATFPDDYKHASFFITGMSVPPYMAERIARQVYKQWFK